MFQTNAYKQAIKTAKIILLLVVSTFIIYKLFFAYSINDLFKTFDATQDLGPWYFLALAFVLMFLNWGIEAVKWKYLISRFEPISYSIAIKAVFSGVTLSIITPNQIGDFAGRVLHLEIMNKWRGSLVTVIGHFAQVIVTLLFGLFSFCYFFWDRSDFYFWLVPATLIIGFLVYLYINLKKIYLRIAHFSWVAKFEKYVNVFSAFDLWQLLGILGLSLLRYFIFLFQYYLLLQFFKVEIGFWLSLSCIIGTFCVQSVVPSFLLLEIGIRGASALAFFSLFSTNHEGILLSAYSLWIVNMLLPSLVGMYFIYKVRS